MLIVWTQKFEVTKSESESFPWYNPNMTDPDPGIPGFSDAYFDAFQLLAEMLVGSWVLDLLTAGTKPTRQKANFERPEESWLTFRHRKP